MLLVLLPLTAVAVTVLTLLAISSATSAEKASRFDQMEEAARAGANDFDAQVRENQALGRSLATLIEGLGPGATRAEVSAVVKRFLDRNPQIIGSYVGFDADKFDGADAAHQGTAGADDKGRFLPYWNRLTGKVVLDPLVDMETSDYWNQPKETGKDSVIEPYLYEGALLTSYTTPVERDGGFVGIGGVDVSLASLDGQIGQKRILDSGYGLLVSQSGIFVAAPDKKLIGTKTLDDLAKSKRNPDLETAAKAIAAGKAGQLETTDPFTGKAIVLSWAPVSTGHWGFLTAVPLDEVLASAHDLRTTLLIAGLLLLIVTAIGIAVFATRFAKPITRLTGAAERLAEGDADVAIERRGQDELARLAGAFEASVAYQREMAAHADRIAQGDLTTDIEPKSDRDVLGIAVRDMRRRLAELVGAVDESSRTLSAASQEMASTSEETGRAVGEIASAVSDVAQGAERQVRSIEQARIATAEVGEATHASARSAEETAAAAADARRIAVEGQRAVADATEAMRQVRTSSDELTVQIRALADKSEQIGGFVETITSIAGQTNLLALNAAIEAARAGEQGKGFAVVAEEVRKLAEECQVAAQTIGSLVHEIQDETGAAVRVVEEGAARTDRGAETVEQARDAFERIGAAVEDMSGRVDSIAAAVEQIAASAQRVHTDIDEVAGVAEESSASSEEVSASTQQTSASAQEIAASAQQLAGTAVSLQQLVSKFKVTA
ncbi:methyl-accepting chemotaxis sensory transducer with Cache sensor [Solirubrobacter pauli]|uniref:Methyl-accepting chemotaxis sensory transducer with Cache sensor n=1 Tax=Solirubrobacter pauli TaxID=166793 RepID=A0A660L3D8_9ACTN|nr:methyl-accepting chemotaxis protein [Solirubrobacter pauli]RKQ86030.1 methyl-accepting chemotaxis sensory transducer with Cache sensor [Solirubrobacter pauli]